MLRRGFRRRAGESLAICRWLFKFFTRVITSPRCLYSTRDRWKLVSGARLFRECEGKEETFFFDEVAHFVL